MSGVDPRKLWKCTHGFFARLVLKFLVGMNDGTAWWRVWSLNLGIASASWEGLQDIWRFRFFFVETLGGIDGVAVAGVRLGHGDASAGDEIDLDIVAKVAADAGPLVAAKLEVGGGARARAMAP